MEKQLVKALKNNKLQKNIDISSVNFEDVNGKLITLNEGQILFREGANAEYVYLVISGEINLLKKKLLGKSKSLIYAEGTYFGYDELRDETARTSTAVALRDTYLIALDKDEIDALIAQAPQFEANLNDEDDEVVVVSQQAEPQKNEHAYKDLEAGEYDQFRPGGSVEKTISEEDEDELETLAKEIGKEEFDRFDQDDEEDEIARFKRQMEEGVFDEPDELPDEDVEIDDLGTEDGSEQPAEELTDEPEAEQPDEVSIEDIYNESFEDEELEQPEFEDDGGVEESADEVDDEPDEELEESAEDGHIDDFDREEEEYGGGVQSTVGFGDAVSLNIDEPGEEPVPYRPEELEPPYVQDDEDTEDEDELSAAQLRMIIEAAEKVNSNIEIDAVLKNIVDTAVELTNADRGTLYLIDKENHELWSKVLVGNEIKEIKMKAGKGIAGWVAQSGEVVNLSDAQSDERFNDEVDKESGYHTKSMMCFPIKNKDANVVGVLQLLNSKNGRFSDKDEALLNAVSLQAAMALENAELVEKLLQTERHSSLGKMVNFLISDIKKPVLVSRRYTEHLKGKELPEDAVNVVNMLMEQIEHVADIVQSTQSYVEGKPVLRSHVANLNDILEDYLIKIDNVVQNNLCVIVRDFSDNVKVKIDAREFYQCFYHIVKNACESMKPGGGNIYISTERIGDEIRIAIKDEGEGIPDAIQSKIFEPFMSHGKVEGTGLGLAITKRIIEAHGGTIDFKSSIDSGTTFYIMLPVATGF